MRSAIQLHAAPLGASDVVVIDGVSVTTLARTVADLARSLSFEQAVVTGDAALRQGLERSEVEVCLARMRRWPGVIQARRVIRFLDGRSESPGESRSRVGFLTSGIPSPEPQHEIYNEHGRLIGRTDFAWVELGTARRIRRQSKVRATPQAGGDCRRRGLSGEAAGGCVARRRMAGRPMDLGRPCQAGGHRRSPSPGLRPFATLSPVDAPRAPSCGLKERRRGSKLGFGGRQMRRGQRRASRGSRSRPSWPGPPARRSRRRRMASG